MYVTKRDGRKEEFNADKIFKALKKAFIACDYSILDEKINELIAELRFWDEINIEDIQNQIEEVLLDFGYKDVAKQFIYYRYQHALHREAAMLTSATNLFKGSDPYLMRENANKKAELTNVQFSYLGGLLSSFYCDKIVFPKWLLKSHDKGAIHIHDKDMSAMSGITNCFSKDTKFITSKGLKSFSDYKDGDEIIVPTHKGNWKKAVVHNYGKQQLYEYTIATVNRPGYGIKVKATENHRWLLANGTETTKLSVGDKLLTSNKLIFKGNLLDSPSYLLKYWCYGFILGDGCTVNSSYMYTHGLGKRKKSESALNFKTRVRLCGHKIKYKEIFEKLGYQKTYIKDSTDIEYLTYEFNKKDFLEKEEYKNLSIEELKFLILGLLCADGNAPTYNEHSNVYIFRGISSSNPKIIDIIENYSDLAGYFITNCHINNKRTNFGERKYPLHEYTFTLQLPVKRASKKGLVHYVTVPYKVIEKTKINIEDVYCLEVEDDHSFLLGSGIVTGNCCLQNLKACLYEEDENGICTVLNDVGIKKQTKFLTACTVASQLIQGVAALQYGGQTITLSHLVPALKTETENLKIAHPNNWKDFYKRIIKDGVQTLMYQVNSMHTTQG